jgi:acetoin utilization deacetylase AcuC-like enzyme
MRMLFISHPDCHLHDMGEGHPESPMRLEAIKSAVRKSDIANELDFVDAPLATRKQLASVHDPDYVDAVFKAAPSHGLIRLDPDTSMNPHSLNAALRAAGAVIHAVDQVMGNAVNKAFCCVRPPGHHAERDRAMGFCIFNNIAVGAAHALHAHGLKRVAIVDFDVHHGNGTEDIFRDNPAVMLCSSFQHPFYPYSGAATRSDHIINLPLPAGTDGHAYRNSVEMTILPALEQFRPELVMFSAGFDAHEDDPLAGLRLHEEDYAWITAEVRKIAESHAGGRIVSVLEGGYDLTALARSVTAHIGSLLG